MFKLQPTSARWLDIRPKVSVLFAPVTKEAARAAWNAGVAARDACKDAAKATQAFSDAYSAQLIRSGVLDWKGIYADSDVEGEEPAVLEFSAEALEQLIADPRGFAACSAVYVDPYLQLDDEKNASSGARNGSSGAATPGKATARRAGRNAAKTARSKSPSSKTGARSPTARKR